MCKGSSGLFKGTKELKAALDESTSIVWNHLTPTAENYDGTILPRSFVMDVPITSNTPEGKIWTHGNATKHMRELIQSIKSNINLKNSDPFLYTQLILYDYYKSLENVVRSGLHDKNIIQEGNWEFRFSKRNNDKYPVVKHALFKGFE